MEWQGIEVELKVPCGDKQAHPVRLLLTGWREYTVTYNPCEAALGPILSRMAPCTTALHEEFLKRFDQDASLRRRLVEALVQAGRAAHPHLIQALGDQDSDVRAAACGALVDIGTAAVPALIKALGHESSTVRAAACQALGSIGDAHAVPQLIQALGDKDSDVRASACGALVDIGTAAVPALIKALGHKSSTVRAAACGALGSIGDAHAVPQLIQALGDQDGNVRRVAHAALVRIGSAAVPALIHALGDSAPELLGAICEVLAQLSDAHAHAAVSLWAHAGEPAAQNALYAVGRSALPLPTAVAQLSARGSWSVLVRALPAPAVGKAVAQLGEVAVPHLAQALKDRDYKVRIAACAVMGQIGSPQAAPYLVQALKDGYPPVRAAACEALGNIGVPSAPLHLLLRALRDKDGSVRAVARQALLHVSSAALRRLLHKARAATGRVVEQLRTVYRRR